MLRVCCARADADGHVLDVGGGRAGADAARGGPCVGRGRLEDRACVRAGRLVPQTGTCRDGRCVTFRDMIVRCKSGGFYTSMYTRKCSCSTNDLFRTAGHSSDDSAVDDVGRVEDADRLLRGFDAARHHRAECRAHAVRAVMFGQLHTCKLWSARDPSEVQRGRRAHRS